jgi:arsenate reductase
MTTTIYHNPRCSKSRATLALLEEHGIEPVVIEYLATPPSVATLRELLRLLDMTPRQLLRPGEAEYRLAGLDDPAVADARVIEAMHAYPVLIERPIVVTEHGARIGRPPEAVLEILER